MYEGRRLPTSYLLHLRAPILPPELTERNISMLYLCIIMFCQNSCINFRINQTAWHFSSTFHTSLKTSSSSAFVQGCLAYSDWMLGRLGRTEFKSLMSIFSNAANMLRSYKVILYNVWYDWLELVNKKRWRRCELNSEMSYVKCQVSKSLKSCPHNNCMILQVQARRFRLHQTSS